MKKKSVQKVMVAFYFKGPIPYSRKFLILKIQLLIVTIVPLPLLFAATRRQLFQKSVKVHGACLSQFQANQPSSSCCVIELGHLFSHVISGHWNFKIFLDRPGS